MRGLRHQSRSSSRKPFSPRQVDPRALFIYLVARWREMGLDEGRLWIAAFGETWSVG